MDENKSLQTNQPSTIQQPAQPVDKSSVPPATSPIPVPSSPQPKKSFLKKPLFWIVVILGFAFAGAYYFIYSNLENKVSTLTNTNHSNVTANPTKTQNAPLIGDSTSEILNFSINQLSSDIQWGKSQQAYEKYFFLDSSVSGKLIHGSYQFSNKDDSDQGYKFSGDTIFNGDGWVQDIHQAADGTTGSSWGYYKQFGNKRKIIHYEYDITGSKGRMKNGENLYSVCPCKYEYTVFVSDLFNGAIEEN